MSSNKTDSFIMRPRLFVHLQLKTYFNVKDMALRTFYLILCILLFLNVTASILIRNWKTKKVETIQDTDLRHVTCLEVSLNKFLSFL